MKRTYDRKSKHQSDSEWESDGRRDLISRRDLGCELDESDLIVLLGTGTPNAFPDRSGPSVAIIVNGIPYIIDFGPGVMRRASAAFHSGIAALELPKIKRTFLTHLHSDHTAGYPDLILTPWVLGRNEPLQVYGPKGSKHMTDHILEAYQEDIAIRINGLEGANREGGRVEVSEVANDGGRVYEDMNVKVAAFPVNHGDWPALGYRFTTPRRTIVISGDTTPVDSLIQNAKGCDILIHEVYSWKGFQHRPSHWQHYHKNMHTSTVELAEIAEKARPGLLVLYHQLFWGVQEDELVDEIRELYDGEVVSGNDLDVF